MAALFRCELPLLYHIIVEPCASFRDYLTSRLWQRLFPALFVLQVLLQHHQSLRCLQSECTELSLMLSGHSQLLE